MVHNCCVFGLRQGGLGSKDFTFHRFPFNLFWRKQWLLSLELSEENVTDSSRVCSLHFKFGITSGHSVSSKCYGVKLGPANPTADRSQRKHLQQLQLAHSCSLPKLKTKIPGPQQMPQSIQFSPLTLPTSDSCSLLKSPQQIPQIQSSTAAPLTLPHK